MNSAVATIDIADDFYEEEQILQFMGIKRSTLRWRRSNRIKHPPCIKLGNRYVYPKDAFKKWLQDQIVESE